MLSALATRLDCWGAGTKIDAFKTGWPAKTRDDIAFYDTGKAHYRYRVRGRGPTIVFTVDPPATLELYDDLLDIFSDMYRVIAVEMPAMGFSVARMRYSFNFEEAAEDLADFCEAVAGKQAILAFSCAAGLAAPYIADKRPDLASKLALLQTTDWQGFQKWKSMRDPKGVLGKPFLGQIAMRKLAPSRVGQWFELAVGNEELKQPFCECARETLDHGAGWALASAYQRYLRAGASPLKQINQPTLVIWGALDRSHDHYAPDRAKNFGPNTRLEVLRDVGHFPELEDPRQTFNVMSSFLK